MSSLWYQFTQFDTRLSFKKFTNTTTHLSSMELFHSHNFTFSRFDVNEHNSCYFIYVVFSTNRRGSVHMKSTVATMPNSTTLEWKCSLISIILDRFYLKIDLRVFYLLAIKSNNPNWLRKVDVVVTVEPSNIIIVLRSNTLLNNINWFINESTWYFILSDIVAIKLSLNCYYYPQKRLLNISGKSKPWMKFQRDSTIVLQKMKIVWRRFVLLTVKHAASKRNRTSTVNLHPSEGGLATEHRFSDLPDRARRACWTAVGEGNQWGEGSRYTQPVLLIWAFSVLLHAKWTGSVHLSETNTIWVISIAF